MVVAEVVANYRGYFFFGNYKDKTKLRVFSKFLQVYVYLFQIFSKKFFVKFERTNVKFDYISFFGKFP